MNNQRTFLLSLLWSMALPITVQAQQADLPVTALPPISQQLELYTSQQHLSDGYDNWHETGIRGSYEIGVQRFQAELATMRRFGESGNYLGIGDTIIFNPDWFGTFSVGVGDGAAYLPRYRIDAFVNRKLLPSKNLVGTLGAGYYHAPDGHIDRNVSLGATYYFSEPWIVQAEIRFNTSNPGAVRTHQQFIAATWGHDKQTQITARYGWGGEGYQSIGEGAALADFRSKQGSLTWRHWLGPQWGVAVHVERYTNPYYQRNGVNASVFWQFR